MHTLKLINSYGVQFLELEGIYGDSGGWRQTKPIAIGGAQTVRGACGKWQWEEVVSQQVSGRTRITARAWEFKLTDFNGLTVSLGLFKNKKLPVGQYRYAYKMDLTSRNLRANGQIIVPRSNIAWQYDRQVKFSAAWAGPFVKVGGQLAAVGTETAIGVVFNMATGQACEIMMEAGRFGPGLGGSAGVAIGVFTGFSSAKAMKDHRESSWDYSISLSSKWDAYVKTVGSLTPVSKLLSNSQIITRLARTGGKVAPQLAKAWDHAGTAGDVLKVCMTGSGRYADDNPTVSMLDLPSLGGGIELGVFKSWTEVTRVVPM